MFKFAVAFLSQKIYILIFTIIALYNNLIFSCLKLEYIEIINTINFNMLFFICPIIRI